MGTGFATTGVFRVAFMLKRATTIPVRRFMTAAVISHHALDAQNPRHVTTVSLSLWKMDRAPIRDVRMKLHVISMGLRVAMMVPVPTPAATMPLRATLMLLLDVMMDLVCTQVA